jgi:predicted enzyme related to lactoylglutathione lyase
MLISTFNVKPQAEGWGILATIRQFPHRRTDMSSSHGKFVWHELMTTDTAAAERFYRSVIGWDARDSGMPGMAYTMFAAGKTDVAGLMQIPEAARAMGAGPSWTGYIAVDDVDATAAQVSQEKGTVFRAPDDIPGVGRFAIVADPQGAVFALFKGAGEMSQEPAPGGTPGHAGWHELHAGDRETAFAFYSKLFGWTKGEALEMGPGFIYQIFGRGAEMMGGMMTKNQAEPMPFWLYYFNVADVDGAVARIESGGGKFLNGPHQVPGGSWIAQARDPQGAMFAVVGPRG